jgi:putative FmdB family regulatory protein
MPLYEYQCPDCGHVFERLVLARSAEPPKCPECGRNRAEQTFSAFATASSKGSGTVCAPSGGG